MTLRQFDVDDVAAGRAYLTAYVDFFTLAEGETHHHDHDGHGGPGRTATRRTGTTTSPRSSPPPTTTDRGPAPDNPRTARHRGGHPPGRRHPSIAALDVGHLALHGAHPAPGPTTAHSAGTRHPSTSARRHRRAPSSRELGFDVIKRVIGLPGDRVHIDRDGSRRGQRQPAHGALRRLPGRPRRPVPRPTRPDARPRRQPRRLQRQPPLGRALPTPGRPARPAAANPPAPPPLDTALSRAADPYAPANRPEDAFL